jgi:hypothetical protein
MLAGCQDFSRFHTPSSCPSSNAVFCDGFEMTDIDSWWAQDVTSGTAAIDPTRAYRGRSSLHLHSDPVAAGSMAREDLFERTAETTFSRSYFLRAFLYLASPAPVETVPLMTIEYNAGSYPGVSVAIAQGQLLLINAANAPFSTLSQTSLPTDRWICLEWEVEQDTSGAMQVLLDGTEVPELSVHQNTLASSPFNQIDISLMQSDVPEAEPAHDLWFDELVVDHQPIGCAE